MPLTSEIVTASTLGAVTLDEVKEHARVDHTDDDALITLMISAATNAIERFINRQLMQATYRLYLDEFPREFRLPHTPVSSITDIKYLDDNGVEQTVSPSIYQADLISEPPRIMEADSQDWPDTQDGTYNTVRVLYVAGYQDAPSIPEPIRLAVKQLAGDMYEHRESNLDSNAMSRGLVKNPVFEQLLGQYRIKTFY